jgi:hypothetical protein
VLGLSVLAFFWTVLCYLLFVFLESPFYFGYNAKIFLELTSI